MDKNIPLSELIRIGAKVSKQHYGDLNALINDGETPRTCAIGAAYLAKFGEVPKRYSCTLTTKDALQKCGSDPDMMVYLPAEIKQSAPDSLSPPGIPLRLANVIACLNDTYRWSREKIADWLESIGL